MSKLSAVLLIAVTAIAFAGTAVAGDLQIYKWVDSQGVVHYSDKPPVQAQPTVTRVALPDFPAPDPEAEAADQAWIASINQWYQSVLNQQAQLQNQEFLAWEESQPTPAPAPATEQLTYAVPVCWQCERFHFRHHHKPALLSRPTPQSFQNSLWHPQLNPFTPPLSKP